ncbi:MAG: MFS transporter [Verrucomicrobiota bacterium]
MAPHRSAYFLLGVIYLGFVSLGLPDGTLGVAWPSIAAELQLPIGLAGAITIVVTLLSGISGFASGKIVARFRTGPVVLTSCALTGLALLAIAHAPGLAWLMLAAVPLGLGAGAVDAGLNGYVARHYSGRHMNWLHACWGVGATCGPLVMGQAVSLGHGWRGGYLVLGSVQLGLAALFLVTLPLWTRVPERTIAASLDGHADKHPTTPANSFAGWLSPALFALYAALELATGLWAASILVLGRGFTAERAAWCVAGFYGAITVGRILVGFIVERVGNRRVVAFGVALALAGAGAFAFAESPLLAAGSLGLIGLGFAPVYPGLMHEVPRRFAPDAAQTVIGRQSGAAYLGMAVLPAALGWLAQHALGGVVWVLVAGIVVLLLGIRRLDRMT